MGSPDMFAAAVTLFFVMDPLGNIPPFNAVLARFPPRRRMVIVARELVFALVILATMLFAGNAMLDFMGLSQSSLRIAGGILLFVIAIRMIFPGRARDDQQGEEEPFIVPLAMPMVAGPSTIAVLLLLSSGAPERVWEWALALLIAWIGATTLLVLSPFMIKVLGTRGLHALERLMGMLLVLLAIQMLLDGVAEFYGSLAALE